MDQSGLELDVVISALNDEVNAIETELGAAPKTVTDNVTATSSPSSVANLLDMIVTQIKGITGGANWYTAATTTLAALLARMPSGTVVGTTDTQALTNKTITISDTQFTLQDNADPTKQAVFQLSGISAGSTRTYTLPNNSFELVDTQSTQSMNNKTFTAPIINDTVGTQVAKTITGYFQKPTSVSGPVIAGTTDVSTGDGKLYIPIPPEVNGMNLVAVWFQNVTAGTTGTMDIQVARIRAGAAVDTLSTKATIDSTETDTTTAATPYVINTSNDDMATNDTLRIDIDAVHTTAAKGLNYRVSFGF